MGSPLPRLEQFVICRKCAADNSFDHSKRCWEVRLVSSTSPDSAVPPVFVPFFVFKAPQGEECAGEGLCFFYVIFKNICHWKSLSPCLFIYLFIFSLRGFCLLNWVLLFKCF